ncbi:unnamed protein product [Fusarium graminearum]|uniref:Chromosome 3, complete genome n=1 Tax=Gibberella zeae (strain ATCC MYA-4620 / CBS 123657 / FGSC 9075 / NRRL 31084 / PH-1) TaxID=229533 RepID=A0A098DZI8_GIBZE|nr:unnamed protein product [Fusarium graminearum]
MADQLEFDIQLQKRELDLEVGAKFLCLLNDIRRSGHTRAMASIHHVRSLRPYAATAETGEVTA